VFIIHWSPLAVPPVRQLLSCSALRSPDDDLQAVAVFVPGEIKIFSTGQETKDDHIEHALIDAVRQGRLQGFRWYSVRGTLWERPFKTNAKTTFSMHER
jgi:hypothetical protein